MSLHPSVEFRALQTKLLSRARFHDSGHMQAFKPRLLHAPTTVQTTTRSLERFLPPTFDQVGFTRYQQHGQRKTQHCVHNRKRSAELGRVVVDTQHSLYSVTRVRWRAVLYTTFHTSWASSLLSRMKFLQTSVSFSWRARAIRCLAQIQRNTNDPT